MEISRSKILSYLFWVIKDSDHFSLSRICSQLGLAGWSLVGSHLIWFALSLLYMRCLIFSSVFFHFLERIMDCLNDKSLLIDGFFFLFFFSDECDWAGSWVSWVRLVCLLQAYRYVVRETKDKLLDLWPEETGKRGRGEILGHFLTNNELSRDHYHHWHHHHGQDLHQVLSLSLSLPSLPIVISLATAHQRKLAHGYIIHSVWVYLPRFLLHFCLQHAQEFICSWITSCPVN